MRSILISTQPQNCKQIIDLDKIIDVRKTKPNLKTPFKVYIYCTKSELLTKSHYNGEIYVVWNKRHQNSLEHSGNITLSGKVIGEFICNRIDEINVIDNTTIACIQVNNKLDVSIAHKTCMELQKYLNNKTGYGLHISNLVIYDKPKDLSNFTQLRKTKFGYEPVKIKQPPRSWYYVDDTVYCKNCKHLMFSDFYGECKKGYKGVLNFDDFCDKGELR